jgi:decaprenyl-phosphate phosphoribosyltransferase
VTSAHATALRGSGRLMALVCCVRPRQWVKNLLVVAAPGAAGLLGRPSVLGEAGAAFALFCAAASATYLVNDVVDRASDRHHPTKRRRPVASGILEPRVALFAAAGLAAVSLAGSAMLSVRLAAVVGFYLAVTTAYSLALKHRPVADLACVTAGFIVRAIGGGVATGVHLSQWFLVVVSFGALFVVAGKRSAELGSIDHGAGEGARAHRQRPSLTSYPPAFLRSVRLLAASVATAAYCLWAFERAAELHRGHDPLWFQLSIVPVVLALLYAELLFETGRGEAPEELAFADRTLQALGVAWLGLFAVGVYG